MRRIFSFVSVFIFLISFLFLLKGNALAFSCTITPDSFENGTTNPSFKIIPTNAGDLSSTLTYDVYFYGSSNADCKFISGNCNFYQKGVTATGGVINVSPTYVKAGYSVGDSLNVSVFRAGTTDAANTCNTMTVKIAAAGSSGNGGSGCDANISSSGGITTDTLFTPDSVISLQADFPSGNTGGRRVRVRSNDPNGSPVFETCYTLENNQINATLGSFSSGSYYVEINSGCNPGGLFESRECYTTFRTSPTCDASCGNSSTGTTNIPPPVCAKSTNGKCTQVATGFGFNIGTDASSFVKVLFGIILSIAGGIAVILIIISGYRILVSQGNPEKIQVAREQLTAAVVGLLFIIFSLVVLQTIGFDILGIPGFGK